MQGIWSGTISFSLVAIPVRVVRAVAPGRISFRMLHRTDYSPLSRRLYCPAQDEMVPNEEIVRGYEIAPERYLPISDEELASVTPERSSTIEIVDFIDMAEVDPVYYDRPYYLVPLKGGEKSYRLLAEVMAQTNRAGLARFVLAEREYLVAVRSCGGALSLITLHYRGELLSPEGIAPKEVPVEPGVKNRIQGEIGTMLAEFDPGKYADSRRERVLDLLKTKARDTGPVEAPAIEDEEGEGPPDRMAALEEAMADLKRGR